MNERRLFEQAELPLTMRDAPHSGSKTSRDAAADIKRHAPALRAVVLAYLASRGTLGATAEECSLDLGMKGDTIRPRICELRESECIEDSGATRNTLAGRKAVVWRFVP